MDGLKETPTEDLRSTLIGLIAGTLHGQGKSLADSVKAANEMITEFGDRMHAEGTKREDWS